MYGKTVGLVDTHAIRANSYKGKQKKGKFAVQIV